LTNDFTGMNESLDVFAGTLQPTLDPPDHSGQHWAFTSVNITENSSSAISGSSAVSSTVASTSGVTESAPTLFSTPTRSVNASSLTPLATSAGHSGLSTGAIIGIAATIGGVAIIAIIAIALLVYFKIKFKRNQAAGEVPDQGITAELPMNMPNEAPFGVGVDTNEDISGRVGSDRNEISSGRLRNEN